MSTFYAKQTLRENEYIPEKTKNFLENVVNGKELFNWTQEDQDAMEEISFINKHITEFVAGKHNLFICSNYTGNGKTSMAVYLAYRYVEACEDYIDICFVNVNQLMQMAKRAINDPETRSVFYKRLDEIKEAPLVVMDDVSSGVTSTHDDGLLFDIINSRKGSTIYTSNITPDQLTNNGYIGARILDRITDGTVVTFNSGSRRGKTFREYFEEK